MCVVSTAFWEREKQNKQQQQNKKDIKKADVCLDLNSLDEGKVLYDCLMFFTVHACKCGRLERQRHRAGRGTGRVLLENLSNCSCDRFIVSVCLCVSSLGVTSYKVIKRAPDACMHAL